jgi:hypothetical protein
MKSCVSGLKHSFFTSDPRQAFEGLNRQPTKKNNSNKNILKKKKKKT